jgi:hypothetical protein
MRTPNQRVLNAVQRPDVYDELVITSDGAPVVLSVWRAEPGSPAVVFLPGTMTHPLMYEEFCDGLAGADLSGLRDGSIRCPVLGVTGRGDPLFPLDYTRQVFDEIVAPAKELLVVDVDGHLLLVEALEQTLPPLVQRLRTLTSPVSRPPSPAPAA